MGNHAQRPSRPRLVSLRCSLGAVERRRIGLTCHAQAVRDYISIVGSSTVYPFATVVAETVRPTQRKFKTPKIESTGSGGGIKAFCGGVGVQHPDIANSSRRITASRSRGAVQRTA